MKNKITSLVVLVSFICCMTNCFQQHTLKDYIVSENYCDSCNKWSGYYFYNRFYLEKDENCLDSALMLIDEALPKCEKEKYDMSIRKLAVLCGKQEYDQAISFMDSINFDGQDYSCYEPVIRRRIYAMKSQSIEDISERNRYLQEITDILEEYLTKNSSLVDSVWKNIDWEYYDSIVMATNQYYLYLSVLKGDDFSVNMLDSLYNEGKINQAGLARLRNTCRICVEFMTFKGV